MVLVVAVVSSLILILVIAVVPILWMRHQHLGNISRSGRGASRKNPLLGILASLQVAISTILVIFSFLFVRAAVNVANLDPGYETDGLLTFTFGFRHMGWPIDRNPVFRRQLNEDLEALPEIDMAATGLLNFLQMTGTLNMLYEDEVLENIKSEHKLVRNFFIGPGFLNVMNIPLLKGREIMYTDQLDREIVVLVNQEFMDRYFPDEEDALNVRFRCYDQNSDLLKVVGIIPNFCITPDIQEYPVLLYSFNQHTYPGGSITAHVNGPVEKAKLAVEALLSDKYGFLGVPHVNIAEDLIRANTADLRSGAILVSVSGIMAMILSIGGLFIVFSYSAVLRQCDFAIRMALGASPRQITFLAFRRFGTICLSGLVIGLLTAYFLTPLSRESLSTVSPHDPMAYGLAAFVIISSVTSISLAVSLRFLHLNPATELQE